MSLPRVMYFIVLISLLSACTLENTALGYTGSVDYPELFKYGNQKNADLETALLSISGSFNDNSVSVTQELLAAILATLDKEVGENYLPVEEGGDYGMGTGCTYKVDGSCRSTPYDGGVDYKGRGYIQITHKYNYQKYCPDCVGTSAPELDVCGCKNQWHCTVTDPVVCTQVKALQPDYAARIFASYYIENGLVSISNSRNYWRVGKVINGGDTYASDFNVKANDYLTFFNNNLDKTTKLLTWLNSGDRSGISTDSVPAVEALSIGFPEESQATRQVTLTLYVHDGSASGPIIQNAQVTGQDAAGSSFTQMTDTNGSVAITGSPGSWQFTITKSGYAANSWSQEITETATKNAFVLVEEPISESLCLEGHTFWVESVAFSPDSQTLASGSDNQIRLWDVSTGAEIRSLEGLSSDCNVKSIAFSPDGRLLASGCSYDPDNRMIKLWDVGTGKEIRSLEGHHFVESVAFSPDGQMLASGGSSGFGVSTARLWDTDTGIEIRLLNWNDDVYSVVFSPDGRTLASGGNDVVKLWDVGTGKEIRSLTCDYCVHSVAFSPDGQTLAYGSSYDGVSKINLWDVSTGAEIRSHEMHPFWVYSIAFSPDGQMLAVGGAPRFGVSTVSLLDVGTGRGIRSLAHSDGVRSIAFSPDGQTLAGGSFKVIRLWDLSHIR